MNSGLAEAGEKIGRMRNRKTEGEKRLREEVGSNVIVREERERENGNNMKQRKKTFENRNWERTIDRHRTKKEKGLAIWASSVLLPESLLATC